MIVISAVLIASFQTEFHRSTFNQKMVVNGEELSHLVLGYRNLTADSLWLRVIQDIDYRDKNKKPMGWVYHMIDAITILDPRFEMPYKGGGVIISVVLRDGEGAARIYERGLRYFPNDWHLSYQASYHYLFELKNCKRAAELLKQSVLSGAPPWMAALSGRLFVKSGQYDMAKSLLVSTIEKNEDRPQVVKDLRDRLTQLEDLKKTSSSSMIKGLNCN